MYDLLILGGSIAGVTAAIYATRRQLNLKLLTDEIGGEIAATGVIENYPGYVKITGWELAQKLKEQLEYNQVLWEEKVWVEKVRQEGDDFVVAAKNAAGESVTYEAKTVIVATGVKPRHLNVPGERELFHRGVTYCAVCDAPLFKNKIVAVVGGGNSALQSALMLGEIADAVYLFDRNSKFKGENVLIEKAANHPKIKIYFQTKILKIIGEDKVEGVEYQLADSQTQTLAVQGIFVHIGWEPNSSLAEGAAKNEQGEIIIDRIGATNLPGLFAAGDVTDAPYKQIVVAAGQGASAALAAVEFLNKR